MTLVHNGRQRFVTAAVDAIASLERVQENWQKGPCVDAVASAGPVAVPDIAAGDADARWPDYVIAAKTAGIQAVAGIPMLAEGEAIGAVNLYDSQPRDWSAEDLRVATIFASIATGYLTHASAAQQQQRTSEQLQQALTTRLIVEQAKVSRPQVGDERPRVLSLQRLVVTHSHRHARVPGQRHVSALREP